MSCEQQRPVGHGVGYGAKPHVAKRYMQLKRKRSFMRGCLYGGAAQAGRGSFSSHETARSAGSNLLLEHLTENTGVAGKK